MRSMKIAMVLAGIIFLSGLAQANRKVVRATEMGSSMWSDLSRGKWGDVVVEFRQGDELPVTFEAQGDLIETRQVSTSYVSIKKNFWLRLSQSIVEISLDGATFKNLSEATTGRLEAGAGAAQNGGVAESINIVFKAFLK